MNTYFYQKVITLQNESYYGIRKENLTTRYTGHRGSVLSLDKNSNIHNTISVFKFLLFVFCCFHKVFTLYK